MIILYTYVEIISKVPYFSAKGGWGGGLNSDPSPTMHAKHFFDVFCASSIYRFEVELKG
jgi:hypothetical protein